MQLWTDLEQVPPGFGPSVVTIGNFDGVHRGHQAVLDRILRLARGDGASAVAVTFEPHPSTVHRPESAPELICGLQDRLALMERTGLDATLLVNYTLDFAAQTPEEFVSRYLVDGLGARTVVVGHDVRFGKQNAGTLATMVELGGQHGFEVVAVDEAPAASTTTCSSRSTPTSATFVTTATSATKSRKRRSGRDDPHPQHHHRGRDAGHVPRGGTVRPASSW